MTMHAVKFPTLPPPSDKIEIPESMSTPDRNKLFAQLGSISTELAKIQARDEERQKALDQRLRAIDARLARLEKDAEKAAGSDLETLKNTIAKHQSEASKMKFWVLSIVATLLTSAVVGLVVHFFGGGK